MYNVWNREEMFMPVVITNAWIVVSVFDCVHQKMVL